MVRTWSEKVRTGPVRVRTFGFEKLGSGSGPGPIKVRTFGKNADLCALWRAVMSRFWAGGGHGKILGERRERSCNFITKKFFWTNHKGTLFFHFRPEGGTIAPPPLRMPLYLMVFIFGAGRGGGCTCTRAVARKKFRGGAEG
jgi:hypothetical protein